jgi:outer membrane protein OmpA-like peptidoglycan-associated protein
VEFCVKPLFRVVPLLVLAAPAVAQAQSEGFELRAFHPSVSQQGGGVLVDNTRTLGHLSFAASLSFDSAGDLLVETGADGEEEASVVSRQDTLSLFGAVGLWSRLELGFEVPFYVAQDGEAPNNLGFGELDHGAGLGDIRVVPKVRLLGGEDRRATGFGLAFATDLTVPAGSGATFQGGGFRTEPRLLGDYRLANGFWLGGSVGGRIQSATQLADYEQGTALTWGLAARVPTVSWLAVTAEAVGSRTLSTDAGFEAEVRRLWLLGVDAEFDKAWGVRLAGGRRLGTGVGNPSYELAAIVSYTFAYDPDPDFDGLVGSADTCPRDAEDFDGFEDGDGCPENDNDNDGVEDINDRCEGEAEDKDGFEDGDGCLDADNDKDGVADGVDQCPNAAEDRDGYEDADGCPEDDNDGDGVLDRDDRCPTESEDKDGFEDADGCLDADNDGDGVLDADDKCADQLETLNGVDDGDGCSDTAPLEINLAQGTVRFVTPVSFDKGTDALAAASATSIDALVVALGAHPGFSLRLVIHSGDAADDAANLTLSTARAAALLNALTGRGVDASRISTAPYALGATDPDFGSHRVEVRVQR